MLEVGLAVIIFASIFSLQTLFWQGGAALFCVIIVLVACLLFARLITKSWWQAFVYVSILMPPCVLFVALLYGWIL